MDVIKENMFFVVMGVVVLVALALFVVLVGPLKSENERLQSEVVGLQTSLDRLVRLGKDLPNMAAIPEAKKYRAEYVRQLDVLKGRLAKMRLSTDLPGLGAGEWDQPGAFKTVYEKNVEFLKRRLSEKSITADAEAWHFWNWEDDVPKQKIQRVLAAKEFSLIRELMAIIMSPQLAVMQVDRIEVNPGETRTADYAVRDAARQLRVEPYFDVFPFVLEIRMPYQKHELLIRELLGSKEEMPIYIQKISMMRLEDDKRIYKYLPTTLYVGLRVDGWALDYRLVKKKPATVSSRMAGVR